MIAANYASPRSAPAGQGAHTIEDYRRHAYAHLLRYRSLAAAVADLVTLGCPHNLAANCVDWVVLNRFDYIVRN